MDRADASRGGESSEAIQLLAGGRVDPKAMIGSRRIVEEVVKEGFEECVVNKRATRK